MTDQTAKITLGDKTVESPVLKGTVGPDVVDIRKFYGQTGAFTYDPGFTSTASCESKLTYIDGDEGVLLHRGYAIGDLAEHSTFMEVAYLLLNGELPSGDELAKFDTTITRHTMLHEQLATFYRGFRRDAHPMAIMCGVVGALSAFYHDSTEIHDPHQRMIASHRLIAKMPTIAAMAYKYSVGQPFIYPQNDLSYTHNFLRMTFGVPAEEYEVDPAVVRALDRIFILHADHEQNASTSTVRLAGSSGANPFACIAAGIACLWGPAHGGANEAALNMLRRGWKVDPAVGFTKQQDVVHRVVGPPGIVLVGEGQPSRVRTLMASERRKHERVASDVPIHEVVCGRGEGEVPLPKLMRHLQKMKRQLRPADMTDVLNRIKALDATRGTLPLPKGPIPTSMKGMRGQMRGR